MNRRQDLITDVEKRIQYNPYHGSAIGFQIEISYLILKLLVEILRRMD